MSSVPSPGIDSISSLRIVVVWVCLLSISCGPATVRQRPLPRAGTPPVERPIIELLVDGQPVAGTQPAGLQFTAILSGTGYQSLHPVSPDAEELDSEVLWVLQFRPEDATTDYRLGLGLEQRLAPRLKRSEPYRVTHHMHHRGMFLPPALAVAIYDESDTLLYLLDVDGASEAALLPQGLTLTRTTRVAFTTALTTASGCALTISHHFLDVTAGNRSAALAPGEERIFRTDVGTYRVACFDISSSRDDVECLSEHPTYSAFLVERVDDDDQ